MAAAIGAADVVINTVPDPGLTAETMVLDRGGLVINVSAMPAGAGRRLRHEAGTARGTVVMNAGIAPGVTSLIAAGLLAAHPQADEVELVFTVSTRSTSGRAGGDFGHRGLTTAGGTARRSFRCPSRSARAAASALPNPMAAGWAAWQAIGWSARTSASPSEPPTAPCSA